MTTAVTATTRDAWADATQVATQEVLDAGVAAARRRAWLRRALPLAVETLVVVAFCAVFDAAVGLETAVAPVWDASSTLRWCGHGLAGVGLVLLLVANARSAELGATVAFVGPADLLPRSERAWVCRQISAGVPVTDDRRAVVAATARRMSHEGRNVLQRVAQVCLLVGTAVVASFPGLLVLFAALVAWTVLETVRTEHRARRARRWLAQDG